MMISSPTFPFIAESSSVAILHLEHRNTAATEPEPFVPRAARKGWGSDSLARSLAEWREGITTLYGGGGPSPARRGFGRDDLARRRASRDPAASLPSPAHRAR